MGPLFRFWRVYLALIVASALWGSLYTAAKPAVSVTGPLQVTLCRVFLASACLLPLVIARGKKYELRAVMRTHWRGILVLGMFNFAASQILALSSLLFLPASIIGVLNNTHPLWVAIGTAALYPPRSPRLLVLGSAVALAGVTLVFLPSLISDATPTSVSTAALGAALALAGSGVIAIGTVIGRRVVSGNDPMAVSGLGCAAAVVPMLLLTQAAGGIQAILDAPPDVKLLLVYVGVGCTAVNFALWYYGLKYLSAAAASAFQYLIAPIGVALAAVFLGEPLTLALLLGTLLIVVGLVATQIASATPAASS